MITANQAIVTLQEITQETLRPILQLEVRKDQTHFVADNAVSIAEAHFSENAWFRAIYANETPVGFIMLYVDEKKPEYFLWRFMIDKDHQGKGYGYRALEQVIEFVRTLPDASQIFTSYVPGEGSPGPFYQRLGFIETGAVLDSEIVMRLGLKGDV